MRKQLLSVMLAGAMAMALAGCGSKQAAPAETTAAAAETQAQSKEESQAETKEERALKVKQLEDEIRREGECLGHILASFKDTIDENNELQKSILRLQNKSALYQKMILNER